MLDAAFAADLAGVLREPDIARKLELAGRLCAAAGRLRPAHGAGAGAHAAHAERGEQAGQEQVERPGRPAHFVILSSLEVPQRPDLTSVAGRRRLLHAVAHIELSAVELALLAVLDFPAEEPAYHRDMLHIAGEEVRHARLLLRRLAELGGELGEEPVHLGLWDTARRFARLVDRLAVVPRILEAKGLDVSAGLRSKLRGAGDRDSAAVLDIVYRDEVGHVARGTRWYRRVCQRSGLDAERHFIATVQEFRSRRPQPFDRAGRLRAGFTEAELAAVSARR